MTQGKVLALKPAPALQEGEKGKVKKGKSLIAFHQDSLIHQLLVNSVTTTLGSGQHTEHRGPGFLSFDFPEIPFSDCIHSGLCEW